VKFNGWCQITHGRVTTRVHSDLFSSSNENKTFVLKVIFLTIIIRNQLTRDTVNSSHHKMVCRVDRRVWRHCDELIVHFDLAFVTFKSIVVVGDFDIAHAAITCYVVHVCATFCFFQVSTPTNNWGH